MNNTLRIVIFSLLLGYSSSLLAEVKWIDRIVAVAGEEIITASELAQETRVISNQLRSGGRELPAGDVLQKEVLERLIVNKLQLQRAKDQGIRIDDFTLDKAIENIAAENRMSLAEFRNQLGREGLDYKLFREDIRKELAITSLRQREVLGRIRVSDSEIEDVLRQHRQGEAQAKSFRIAHILVTYPANADADSAEASKALKTAAELRRRAAAGEDFATLARNHSQAGNASSGGDLGWRDYAEVPSVFQSSVTAMGKGDVSDVIQRDNSLHIVKLVDLKSASGSDSMSIPEFRTRHILISTEAKGRSDTDARSQAANLRQRILNGEDFAELAKKFSDDTGSGKEGGDLGWAPASTYVKEFADAVEETPRGQISQPFRTQFGYHVVQVLEQRQTEVTDQHLRSRARELLTKKKQDEELQNWVRQLRDEAFVEYRLNDKG